MSWYICRYCRQPSDPGPDLTIRTGMAPAGRLVRHRKHDHQAAGTAKPIRPIPRRLPQCVTPAQVSELWPVAVVGDSR